MDTADLMHDERIDDDATRRALLAIAEMFVLLPLAVGRCGRCGHTADEDHRVPSGQSPVDGVARCVFPASRPGFAPIPLCDCPAYVDEEDLT